MAKATNTMRPVVPVITLELSLDEAETLRGVCGFIGGPVNGRRGNMDNIGQALRAVGVKKGFEASDINEYGRIFFNI